MKEIKTENIKELIAILEDELYKRETPSFINHSNSFQNKLKYIENNLDKNEILSTYDCHRAKVNMFYYEIIEENYRNKEYAPSLQSTPDIYDVTSTDIKYYPNLNLYIKITHNEYSEYVLVIPVLKLKVEYE